jgi:hypothetical protein
MLPNGSSFKQAAAWELVVASIILFVMVCLRGYSIDRSITINSPMGFFKNLMIEKAWPHAFLYFILFALVFSSTLSFFIDV